MVYKFTETNKVNDEFTKVFGIGFKPFYDGLVSVATKQLWIDVLKFDEWLQKKHGNYEDEGRSMNDVIREHYGDKGVKLVDALTGADDEKGPKSDKREDNIKETKPQETMEPKKMNERIAMAMLRQCALVWEHCAKLDRKVTSCELKFADVWNGMGDYRMWQKCPIGQIEVDVDKCEHQNVFDRKMQEVDGTDEYTPDGRWTMVKMFFQTTATDPNMGFGCSYPLDGVFGVARDFCKMNGCQSLMNKMVFGMDSNGRYARLPEVAHSITKTKTKTKKAKAEKLQTSDIGHQPSTEPTLAERLREALLKQLAKAA